VKIAVMSGGSSIQGNLVPKSYQEILRKIKIERMANFIIFTKSVIERLGNSESGLPQKLRAMQASRYGFQHTEAI
jgi:hypothetical protein